MTEVKTEKPKKSTKKVTQEQQAAPVELPPVGSAARKAMIMQGLIKE